MSKVMINNSECISVIVVSYNSKETIRDTLDSIKAQTYPLLELIITDDGSEDGTVELAEKWLMGNSTRFVNIKIIKSRYNTGIPANCNRGVDAATSRLFKLIAADDILYPGAIEIYSQRYRNGIIHQAKVSLFGDYEAIKNMQIYCERSYRMLMRPAKWQYHGMLAFDYIVAPAVGLLCKEDLIVIGGFDERFPGFEDYPAWIKYLESSYTFELIDEQLVRYRVRHRDKKKEASLLEKSSCDYFYKVKKSKLLQQGMYYQYLKQLGKNINLMMGIKYGKKSWQYKITRPLCILNIRQYIGVRLKRLSLRYKNEAKQS